MPEISLASEIMSISLTSELKVRWTLWVGNGHT